MSVADLFHKKSLIIVLSYTPAGLGHLRVTQALYHGLPGGVTPVLLGAQEKSIRFIYRLISSNPFTRMAMEFVQNGVAQDVFTAIYRYYLRNDTKLLKEQLLTLLEQRVTVPQTLLVVASHYGLAHQLAMIKQEFEKAYDINIILAVQVTDDSPQPIWYVYGADMIFVPSEKTKKELQKYGKREHLPEVPMTVNAYPVSPLLSDHLTKAEFDNRVEQVTYQSEKPLHIAIPVSGAAIGMDYYTDLINHLHQDLQRADFHIVTKSAPFTQEFITAVGSLPYASVATSVHDRGTVDLYEQLYRTHTIGLEITKPSEQAFKVLFTPKQIGGAIMLFATPVGRQEYDNLAFMRRHGLIPSKQMQQKLFDLAAKNSLLFDDKELILALAKTWRGVQLPKKSAATAQFILWCLRQGIFAAMTHYEKPHDLSPEAKIELSDEGIRTFWQEVANLLVESQS